MNTLLLRQAPRVLASPRPFITCAQLRHHSRLNKEVLQVTTPVAEKLEATGLWKLSYRGTKTKKPKGDKARVNIVDQKLCDDIIGYIKPSLERHSGCDLISIYPGAGLWNRALHDVLQPRSHILMEPDGELYKPFLDPLLDLPGTRLVPKSGIVWTELNEVLDPAYLPHQVERSSEPPTRNDTLLITANLAFFPKKKFRTFTSVASLVLYQLISSIRASSLFQKYGLVRILIWVGDDEKSAILPRSVQQRRRLAVEGELATDWITEICGADVPNSTGRSKPGWYFRDRQIELESCRNVMDKMLERGTVIPAGRESKLIQDLVAMGTNSQTLGAAGSFAAVMDRPYRAELDALEMDFARKRFNTTSEKYDRLKKLRYRRDWDATRGNTILDLLHERDAIVDDIESGKEEVQHAALVRAKEWSATVHGLNKNLRQEFALGRDNLHVFQQDPPVLNWDRRQLEPLIVQPTEFFPNIPCSLLDIQPKVMHHMMRDIGPQSKHAGDTFELILGALVQNSTIPVSKALETVWPGAADGVIPHCPSLRDRSQGGVPLDGWGQVSPRALNERQLCEILEAWMGNWLFRPTFSDLVGRIVEDQGEDVEEEDAGTRAAAGATF